MSNEQLLLNGVYVNNWNALNQAFPRTLVQQQTRFSTINLNGKNGSYITQATQNDFHQTYPILSNLLQPVSSDNADNKENETAHNDSNCSNDTSYVSQEHDYIKKPAPEATRKGNIYLTINITKCTKGINVNDICGVVLLLKNSSPPIVVNNINIHVPNQTTVDDHVETTPEVPVTVPTEVVANSQPSESTVEVVAPKFNCPYCAASFFSKNVLNTHIRRSHTNNCNKYKRLLPNTNVTAPTEAVADSQPSESTVEIGGQPFFNCPHCEAGFFSKNVLKTHIRRNHIDKCKKYKCLGCSKSYTTRKLLDRHRKMVHFVRCGYCKDAFELVVDYKKHLQENHKEIFYRLCKPFFCEYCEQEIEGCKGDFLKHLRSHGKVICGVCGEGFSSKQDHKTHMEIHPDEYFCPDCNKGFKLKETLKAHEETHNDPYSAICTVCKRGFKTKMALKNHMIHIHTKKRFNYMCDQCPKMFQFPQRLARHQKVVHDGVKDYPCSHCDKKFSSASTRKSHVDVMHLKVKPYQCEYCGKRFARRDYVINHSKIHQKSGDSQDTASVLRRIKNVRQPVQCKICGHVSSSSLTLRMHLKYTHGTTRKFKCRHCNLMFMFKTTRFQHEKLHTDPVNKFLCPICWKRMATKEELAAHQEEHNEPNIYICDICNETFSMRSLLDSHVYSEHANDEEIQEDVKEVEDL